MARDFEHWPYSASIAWGLWRTRSALLRAWGDDTVPGIAAIRIRAETPTELFPDEGDVLAPLEVIEAGIREALVAGRIGASGITPRGADKNKRIPIPASFWDGAIPAPGSSVDRFIKRDDNGPGITPFADILLNARELVRAFPKPLDKKPAPADAVFESAPEAADEMTVSAPIKANPDRAPEPLRRFLCEYLLEEHGGKWPAKDSLNKIRGDLIVWVKGKYGLSVSRPLGKTATSSLSRFRKDKAAFDKSMQWVRAKTQQ
ncbi:hypothetical protein [Devosia sp. CN2-171]|uniref:hypothetical protein n=1 Tax=Devosia sp. CN2-171 TaxID=3400909 RepID=UPI003BF7BCD6